MHTLTASTTASLLVVCSKVERAEIVLKTPNNVVVRIYANSNKVAAAYLAAKQPACNMGDLVAATKIQQNLCKVASYASVLGKRKSSSLTSTRKQKVCCHSSVAKLS